MKTRRKRYESPPRVLQRQQRNTRRRLNPLQDQRNLPRSGNDSARNEENLTSTRSTTVRDLNEIYHNVKSIPNYSSKIRDFLRENQTSSLFKPVRHNFPRRRIKTYFPFQMIMSDTINYRKYAKPTNHNFKYIMVAIDVFSKKAWAAPLKRLNDFDSTIAMESILKKIPEIPQTIITDKGTEYYNSKMGALFDRYGIKHYSIRGRHKACVAERFIRTLKSRLEKYFWANRTHRWVDILDQFIRNYNATYHRSIKMAPDQVNESNRSQVFKTLYPKLKDNTPPRLSKGDRVRILRQKNIFEKGYTRNWSEEIYLIVEALSESGVDFYKIADQEGNILPRHKYYWQLNLVSKNAS